MTTTIAAAGNTQAPALAVLHTLGYQVSRAGDAYRATLDGTTLIADDLLSLLGLAKLREMRGPHWQPSDAEIAALFALEGISGT